MKLARVVALGLATASLGLLGVVGGILVWSYEQDPFDFEDDD